jgi:hypothetical protein
MAYSLTGLTADTYTASNTLLASECWIVDLIVGSNPLVYQLQYASKEGSYSSQGFWLPEQLVLASTNYVYQASLPRRCTGIRLRSYNPGNPALYQVSLVPPQELPPTLTYPYDPLRPGILDTRANKRELYPPQAIGSIKV